MPSTHLPHLSLLSAHRPSSIPIFLIIVSASVIPFLAFPSIKLIGNGLPDAAYTFWDYLLTIFTSSPFYFFLLNFLIIALVCLSGALHPAPKHRDSDGPQEDWPQSVHHLATNIIHERLALDELYGSQTPSPSYLLLLESSNVYHADDANSHDEGEDFSSKQRATMPDTTSLVQKPAFLDNDPSPSDMTFSATTEADDVVFSASEAHLMDAMKKSNSAVTTITTPIAAFEGGLIRNRMETSPGDVGSHIVKLHQQVLSDAGTIMKDAHVHDDDCQGETDVCEKSDHEAHNHGRRDDEANERDDDAEADGTLGRVDDIHHEKQTVATSDDDNDNDDDDFGVRHGDGSQGSNRRPLAQTTEDGSLQTGTPAMAGGGRGAEEEGDVGDEKQTSNGESSRDPTEETAEMAKGAQEAGFPGRAGEGAEEGLTRLVEEMSTEELNERANAFISAFRRKLISTADTEAD